MPAFGGSEDGSLTELTEFTENDLVMPFPSALLRINGRLPLMITTRSRLSLETQRTRRTEDRYQMSDVGCWMSEGRGQMSEVGGQRAEGRGQMSDVRGQMTDIRCRVSGFRNQRAESCL